MLAFSPVKARIQDALDRLFYRERYRWRKTLVRLSEDLNADLDLELTAERLLQGIGAALGLREMALLLPDHAGDLVPFRSHGVQRTGDGRPVIGVGTPLIDKLKAGQPVDVDQASSDDTPLRASGLAWLFPCRVKGEVIAVLGVGRKDGLDPLNSEEVDTLKTLAAQAATAIMNGRLYQRLAEKAEELRGLRSTTRTSSRASTRASSCSTSTAASCAGIARWRASTAGRAPRCSGSRSTPCSRRPSWRRCAARWCSAATTRSRTSTSSTCPRPTAAARWSTWRSRRSRPRPASAAARS